MKREEKQAILDEMILVNEATLPKISVSDPLVTLDAILANYEQMILNHVDTDEGIRRMLTPLLVAKHVIKYYFAPEGGEEE